MAYITYTLEAATYTREILNDTTPSTITFKSTAANRKIELSTDGGAEYFIPTYDSVSTTQLVITLVAPVTHLKVTGNVNDVLILVN